MRFVVALVLACLIAGDAHAYSRRQGEACYPDAVRLCGAPRDYKALTAAARVELIACMIAHYAQLSRRCLAAFGR